MEYEYALDVCEEGELPLSPIKDPTPTRSSSDSPKGLPSLVMDRHPFVTRETQHQVMERLTRLKRDWHCQRCNYTVVGGEQARVHAWSHHVAFVCQCGFITARRDTVMSHVQRTHKEYQTITQVDASCWSRLRETHSIPQRMPTLPIIHLGKERKRKLPITPPQEVMEEEEEEEPQVVKITRLVTPLRKKPVPAPRKHKTTHHGRSDKYLHPNTSNGD